MRYLAELGFLYESDWLLDVHECDGDLHPTGQSLFGARLELPLHADPQEAAEAVLARAGWLPQGVWGGRPGRLWLEVRVRPQDPVVTWAPRRR